MLWMNLLITTNFKHWRMKEDFLLIFWGGFENDDEIDKELGLVNPMKYELQKTAKKQLEECDAKIAKLTSEKD